MWADKSPLVGCSKIDARLFSDTRRGLLFTGQIAFAAKMSSDVRWEMRCSDLRRWLENIIRWQLWNTNYLWLPVIRSVTAPPNLSPRVIPTVATEQGVIGVEEICFANRPLLNFTSDQPAGAADGATAARPRAVSSVRQPNDLLCKPLFTSDNMQSGYFGINGPVTLEGPHWGWQPHLRHGVQIPRGRWHDQSMGEVLECNMCVQEIPAA